MRGNPHVRFGGGRLETQVMLGAGRLSYCVVIHQAVDLVQEAEKYIAKWVGRMGLQLKPENTRIVHSLLQHAGKEPGFNFLGFNCRQYRRTEEGRIKTLIKPEKDKV